MPPPTTNADVLKQIQEAWNEAQAQLAALKSQVAHLNDVAMAKVASNVLERDMDRAYRDLGEAVWAEVSKGKLVLPNSLSSVKQSLAVVTERIRAQNASINDLLAEGEDVARRLQEKMAAASKAVAPQRKRR